jgi:retron-type reverse transcriptase
MLFDKNKDKLLLDLQRKLINGEYETSEYYVFKIYEPKEREIFKLPYYPDRIVHHAIMNIMEPIWVSAFVKGTYSCIRNRGIHKALKDVKFALKDEINTQYCLKLDIRKFYHSIDHDILKTIIRKKIKDKRLLSLLDEIIESA